MEFVMDFKRCPNCKREIYSEDERICKQCGSLCCPHCAVPCDKCGDEFCRDKCLEDHKQDSECHPGVKITINT